MLKVVHEENESDEASGSLLDEIVRDGGRQMLVAALQAEVAAYVEAHAEELDEAGHRLVFRNGHHAPREVTTAAGAVPVRAPLVNDKRIGAVTGERPRFSSAILPAWSRKSLRVAEVLPLLYFTVHLQHGPVPVAERMTSSFLCLVSGHCCSIGPRACDAVLA